jgi:hypothetical protein
MKHPHVRNASRIASASVATWAVLACAVNIFNGDPNAESREIHAFTALDANTFALKIRRYHPGWSMGGQGDLEDQMPYVIFDKRKGTLRAADSLPLSAVSALPGFFYACESGQPFTIHPQGPSGDTGQCTQRPSHASGTGALTAWRGTLEANYNILNWRMERIDTVPEYDLLELDEAAGTVATLAYVYYPRIGNLWKLRKLGTGQTLDSAWVASQYALVRVAGKGRRLVCSDSDRLTSPNACWLPEGVPAFADSARFWCGGGNCEWTEALGRLIAIDGSTRIHSMRFDGKPSEEWDLEPKLKKLDLSAY